MTVDVFTADVAGEGLRIGVVQARFNEPVCNALREACVKQLLALGVHEDDLFVCTVPGALEIANALNGLARTGEFDALVALGAVIRGETYHFEVVSNESARGIAQVALDSGLPIANGVLTTENDAQAMERAPVKGADAARVAVEMAGLLESIASLSQAPDDDGQ